MMLRGLQVGFGAPIGAEPLAAIAGLGVELVRLDCQQVDPIGVRALMDEVSQAGLLPVAIIREASQLHYLAAGANVEVMNEPDLRGPSPSVYTLQVEHVARAAEGRSIRVWAGAISNLNTRGLDYLAAAKVPTWPATVNVSVHRYPTGDGRTVPHRGFTSREAEVDALRTIIGARSWAVSEYGFSTANRASWWQKLLGIEVAWSDGDVALMVRDEWVFWETMGARAAVLYQINDGPSRAVDDHYGIRRIDGSWKPSAFTFARRD